MPDFSDNANEIDGSIQAILSGTLPSQRISTPNDSIKQLKLTSNFPGQNSLNEGLQATYLKTPVLTILFSSRTPLQKLDFPIKTRLIFPVTFRFANYGCRLWA